MIEFLAQGIGTTVQVTFGAFVIAALLGAIVAGIRRCPFAFLRWLGGAYVALVRGVPPVAWLFLVFFGLQDHLPLEPVPAAIIALGIAGSGYMAEIYRAALEAVPAGQVDAADALAMSRWDKYRLVMIPSTAGLLAASTASYVIALLKDSALASLIGVMELTGRADVYRRYYNEPILAFAVIAVFYVGLSVAVAVPARHLERRILRRRAA
ncbi:amino acid ABC transporter permease [Nocardioides sp. GXZ039]|uniref:amino acid ABC transporter permease n=1 Tax=Nocardioides sp. GXZ039 TaxID=3136018 RepID=UPI0030F47079